ncbi:hypothetical protein [Mesorhizobium sp. CA4]|uniref:hypothetical protein n=1 Tax=Mesorhizobium sp. CA4 TaxID=588499 RepID=UPI001CD078A1|nr:hypothetical protein [Mesorhizobium sp. CA4]MBZ9821904.1 hypothetical protein [Mesorhizobium sp. CA4]
MVDRSNRAEVRNPVLALPAAAKLQALPPEVRQVVAEVLRDLSVDARARAQVSWRKNKGPMAAYWKAVGAYATHLYRAVRPC